MNVLKKQLIKNFIKLAVIKNEPGILMLQVTHLSKLSDKYKVYENYVIQAVQMLGGTGEVLVDYKKSAVTINYNVQSVTAQKIYNWVQVIIDVALNNLEFIEKYGEDQTEYTVQKLKEVLLKKIKVFEQ